MQLQRLVGKPGPMRLILGSSRCLLVMAALPVWFACGTDAKDDESDTSDTSTNGSDTLETATSGSMSDSPSNMTTFSASSETTATSIASESNATTSDSTSTSPCLELLAPMIGTHSVHITTVQGIAATYVDTLASYELIVDGTGAATLGDTKMGDLGFSLSGLSCSLNTGVRTLTWSDGGQTLDLQYSDMESKFLHVNGAFVDADATGSFLGEVPSMPSGYLRETGMPSLE